MTDPTIPTTHTTVVGIPNPDDAESIAKAAAHAALSLLTKVSAEHRSAVSIQSVTITTPEHVRPGPSLAALLNGGAPVETSPLYECAAATGVDVETVRRVLTHVFRESR